METKICKLDNKPSRVGLFIQARTGSTRLPNKVTKKINKKTILERCLISLIPIFEHVDTVAILAPNIDRFSFEFIKKTFDIEILVCSGSEENVLKRFVKAIHQFNVDYVIRICSDRVINDWETQLKMLSYIKENDLDFISCEKPPLRSITGEIYKSKALLEMADKALIYNWANEVSDEIQTLEGYIPSIPFLSSLDDISLRDVIEHISIAFKNEVEITSGLEEEYPYDFSIDTKEDFIKARNIIIKLYNEKILLDHIKDPVNHIINYRKYMEYFKEITPLS